MGFIELTIRKVLIAVKWASKVQLKSNGNIAKHKARLVPKGFMQNDEMQVDDKSAIDIA